MSAKINVVNYALSLLGANPITSLEDDAHEAKVMKTFYYEARDGLLEVVEWSFAIKRFKPAKSTDEPLWGWSSSFPIPSDILRVLTVESDNTYGMNRDQVDHVVEQRSILCNEDNIVCTGIRRIDDEGVYSPLFNEAFAVKLAVLACLAITESNTKFQQMAAMYAGVIKDAKSRDGQQGTTRRVRSRWINRARQR